MKRQMFWTGAPTAIARQYFPDFDDDEIGWVIWNRTGYPCFWDGPDAETSFRTQLAEYAAAKKRGVDLCEFCTRPAMAEQWLCAHCEEVMSEPPQ